eukprot:7607516-Ditylum_brightwellii.AAC.1
MGSVSLAGIAGGKMAAVETELRKHPLFQGKIQINLITAPYMGQRLDPALLEYRLELNDKGHQIPIIWIYCDNFLVHGATHKECCEAVMVVMDTLLRLGLLVRLSKIKWPVHRQQFCSFIYDITSTPRIEVPIDKQDNVISLLTYLESIPPHLSYLALSVVVGRLQSMVSTTLGNVRATYLRHLYDILHADDGSGILPIHLAYFYYSATLIEEALSEVDWWKEYLFSMACAVSRPSDPMVLATTWGDGSGTGTGGTFCLVLSKDSAQSNEEWWIGVWANY